MMDLLSAGVGGRIVEFNDEFFAEAANLIKEEPPVWREGLFTEQGKWMDGWETRRRREPGHDFCVLALGIPGAIRKVTVDTSFFTGNFPESFSLEACGANDDARLVDVEWVELIPRTELQGDAVALFEMEDPRRVTHLRLNIFPDGGIARLRVDGDPIPAKDAVCPDGPVDLATAVLGGEALEASNAHYSHPANMLKPVPSRGMWDGWETKRRRGPGHDWATFRLGLPGTVERVLVDTSFFRGNSPGWVSFDVSDDGVTWGRVFEEVAVKADSVNEIPIDGAWHASQVRLSIHPDGGVARLRVLGRPDADAAGAIRVRYLNALFTEEARSFFHTACGARRWVDAMVDDRPYEMTGEVLEAAERAFDGLAERDWLEAFAAHPRIGERGDAVASREQAGTESAGREVIRRLSDANRAYERRFGFIYIVYASGKSAEEMLEIAERRLGNTRETELRTAADEQRKITATRLRRMMCQEAG
jgi:allantoicase